MKTTPSTARRVATRRQCKLAAACAVGLSLGSLKNEHKMGIMSSWHQSMASSFYVAGQSTPANQQQQSSNDEYDESGLPPRPLNYYEMLNLETPDTHRRPKTKILHNRKKRSNYRARITKDQIKKAYRKQAQLYHPDKASRHNMTTEEATSRFAEIAEAYQVSLPWKK